MGRVKHKKGWLLGKASLLNCATCKAVVLHCSDALGDKVPHLMSSADLNAQVRASAGRVAVSYGGKEHQYTSGELLVLSGDQVSMHRAAALAPKIWATWRRSVRVLRQCSASCAGAERLPRW